MRPRPGYPDHAQGYPDDELGVAEEEPARPRSRRTAGRVGGSRAGAGGRLGRGGAAGLHPGPPGAPRVSAAAAGEAGMTNLERAIRRDIGPLARPFTSFAGWPSARPRRPGSTCRRRAVRADRGGRQTPGSAQRGRGRRGRRAHLSQPRPAGQRRPQPAAGALEREASVTVTAYFGGHMLAQAPASVPDARVHIPYPIRCRSPVRPRLRASGRRRRACLSGCPGGLRRRHALPPRGRHRLRDGTDMSSSAPKSRFTRTSSGTAPPRRRPPGTLAGGPRPSEVRRPKGRGPRHRCRGPVGAG